MIIIVRARDGRPVAEGASYVGTAPRTSEGLVWHLYEVTS